MTAARPVLLRLPFRGRWTVQNSPAKRVPSHGTDLFGTAYAIDFVAVDAGGRSAPPTWRAVVGVEPPERFTGFGAPILAPAPGVVAVVHDGEPDHEARRSPSALLGYALTQAARARQGPAGIAGNHVVLAVSPQAGGVAGAEAPGAGTTGSAEGAGTDAAGAAIRAVPGSSGGTVYVLLAHLQRGSVTVGVGDVVEVGARLGRCGNSGNSTEPHVHVQVTDSMEWTAARGLPLAFEHPDGGAGPWLPRNREVFEVH